MTLASGRRLGPYEIVAPIGAGGMGEVWRARDTRLDRTVAIKVLPAELSANAQLKVRFEREAKTISQLTHPHICTLYDVGHADGIDFLVMEHLEGESLADRLAKGPLPMEQLLRHGVEIAEALERAHRAGVVHRDLKPGNIMLTKSGAKLLDFGLAKPVPFLGGESAATEHKPLTAEGTIVGTFQYMAPEQIDGRDADQRTDLFAFGVVLYEMATGKRAFEGKTRASLIAAILDRDPEPISSTQPLTPPALEHLVRRCLAKDPDDRWQTAHDVRLQLEWISHASGIAAAPGVAKRRVRDRVAWTAFALALIAAIAFAALYARKTAEPLPVVAASIIAPDKTRFAFRAGGAPPEVSPDGTRVVFGAIDTERKGEEATVLWVREIDEDSAQRIGGTEGASYPFWSPDGSQIAFFADGKLKRVALSGAPPVALCDAPTGRGGTWHGDTILYGTRFDAIYRTTANGAPPVAITKLDPSRHDATHRWPLFLPDGRHFLYLASPTGPLGPGNAVWVASLERPTERRMLVESQANVSIAGEYLIYMRERSLVAQKLDARTPKLTGDPIPLVPTVAVDSLFSRALFSASPATLVLQRGGGETTVHLATFDGKGTTLNTFATENAVMAPALSADDKMVAIHSTDGASGKQNIWIVNRERGTLTRFSFGSRDASPVWSHDRKWIAYGGIAPPFFTIMQQAADGSSGAQPLLRVTDTVIPTSWSGDGRFIAFTRIAASGVGMRGEIWILSLADRSVRRLLGGNAVFVSAQFSPDGRWLAYSSDETGRLETYVTRFPDARGKWQVSTGGGRYPRWSRDGKRLYYIGGDQMLAAVDIETSEDALQLSRPQTLFHLSVGAPAVPYDVARNGTFVVTTPVFDESEEPLTLITNWKAKIGAK